MSGWFEGFLMLKLEVSQAKRVVVTFTLLHQSVMGVGRDSVPISRNSTCDQSFLPNSKERKHLKTD